MSVTEMYSKIIKDYSSSAYTKLTREGRGRLNHPFLVPGAVYQYELWDWDSWLTDVGIRQILRDTGADTSLFYECEKGCILNFLEHTDDEGNMPITINSEQEVFFLRGAKNIHKPCIAQHLAFILKETGNEISWLGDKVHKLEAFIDRYRRTSYHAPTGLYFFLDDTAIGVDNDPCIFYRPDGSCASVYLNVLMYKELMAMSYVFGVLGDKDKAEGYESEAKALAAAINEHLWDERCGMYYSADINLNPIDPDRFLHSGKPRHWHSLIMRIDSWSGFLALWAGIATPEQAKRVIEENMLCERTFLGKYGIRSLSRLEKTYAVWKSGNPSCWLGPVWINVSYFCFRALLRYGYEDEARALADTTALLVGKDIAECGEMHEYYHPDTGEGVNNRGFQSWNLLVNNMLAYLEGRSTVEEF